MTSKEAIKKARERKGLPLNTECAIITDNELKVIEKDLDILEILKENGAIVIEGDNRYILIRIKEYDYLRRPIDDFDKVRNIFENK